MRYIVKARLRTLLAQQSGHIQLLIFAPILTLFLLSLVVRTANSAIDPTFEKKKITYQLKQRLIEVRNAEGNQSIPSARVDPEAQSVTKSLKTEVPITSEKEASGLTSTSEKRGEIEFSTQVSDRPWVVAESASASDLLSVSPTEALDNTSPRGTEDKQQSIVAEPNLLSTQWQVAKDDVQHFASFSLIGEEKSQAVAKIRNLEDVKTALENPRQKKPAPVLTAAVAPVPLPAPKFAQREEPSVSFPEYLSYRIKKNETLEKILKHVGVPKKEAARWIRASQKLTEFRSLRPGQVIELFFAQDVENPGLKTVTYVPEEDVHLILDRKTPKLIEATRILPPTQPVWLVLGGRIEKSLLKSIKKTGVSEQIVKSVIDLDWEIDLSDLRTGDSFKILVEAKQRGRKIIEYKSLLAAELSNHGETFSAFSLPEERQLLQKKKFEEAYRGQGLDIESEGEKFLRFPLQFSRISSSFSGVRFHPILHRTRSHNGIDFAAPRGTPVYSVAKGVVTFVGRQSGYGNIVKVDHPGPYETAYAHLQSFATGLEEGAEIRKGYVVGYVGSTGLATGPHLHFELLKDGTFVNPFTERSEEEEEIVASTQEELPAPVDPLVEEKKKALAKKMAALEIRSKSFTSLVIPQQENVEAAATASNRQGDDHQQASSEKNVRR
jgi:murein DD-endopeptidase MepM/ murein hydrolase activator NlpD